MNILLSGAGGVSLKSSSVAMIVLNFSVCNVKGNYGVPGVFVTALSELFPRPTLLPVS
ncbi:hypothetical protein QTL95_24450 [Rhizobium sp. S152]|uniref:hypothetical protein n=1 Tax=Rhizobium sp. S152 TaxID=3055038 RepID=UPI0025AA17BB|nr:hypothetical protein [Rhizobium sp. S152]MDM9629049.1 hypothetical protein [Rhizobium sp. S152]